MYHHFLYHLLNTYTPRRQLPVSAQVPESLFVASEAQFFAKNKKYIPQSHPVTTSHLF